MISLTQFKCLQRLVDGGEVAASRLRSDIADELLAEGYLTVKAHGCRRLYSAINPSALKNFLSNRFDELRDFDSAPLIISDRATRGRQAKVSGNSKAVAVRSCPGFPVNCYEPIECRLNGHEIVIAPSEGSFVFINGWQSFSIPADVTVVGVENMENFIRIRNQRRLFSKYMDSHCFGPRLLFVSRYPQSDDLHSWLQTIPNLYVHFGDFDLEGIEIFLTSFHRYIGERDIGERASFLIPDDIEERLASGSTLRYNMQYASTRNVSTDIPELQRLISLIRRYRRCYDQEGYIDL